jgi:hypothetical protein
MTRKESLPLPASNWAFDSKSRPGGRKQYEPIPVGTQPQALKLARTKNFANTQK